MYTRYDSCSNLDGVARVRPDRGEARYERG